MHKTLSEFGFIKIQSEETQVDNFNEIFITEKQFESLKSLVLSQNLDYLLNYSFKKGREQFQVKNYVGVLELNDISIEILPKTGNHSIKEARKSLLKMLRKLPNSPYKTINEAHLNLSELPVFEIYIYAFISELEHLLKSGIMRDFESIVENNSFLKGKLLVKESLKNNYTHRVQFTIQHNEFSYNIALNKIIKSTLFYLFKEVKSISIQSKIQKQLETFSGIEPSHNIEHDFALIIKNLPLYKGYQSLISWCRIFLTKKTFIPAVGSFRQSSLLFPTEILFENYVSSLCKKHFHNDFEIKIKNSSKFLIENHQEMPKFRLIPDILLKNSEKTIILDTKWKLVDDSKPKQNYGLDQADLYQMYAYGKKYKSNQIFLIYPSHEKFRNSLQVFDYEQDMKLFIIPFDVGNDPESEIQKIINLL